jgi:FkbM family methyltransferase
MKPLLNRLVHKTLAAAGLSAVRSHQTYEADRTATMRRHSIDLVIDVGANAGQYATDLRRRGYSGAIISVEPLPDAYASLKKAMQDDINWSGVNAAVGSTSGRSTLNVSADSVCSSLLRPSDLLLDTIPSARIVKTLDVDVIRLDDLDLPTHERILLKLDVQGCEKMALAGAERLMGKVDVLELELGLKQGYQAGYTLDRALPELTARGFSVTSVGRGVSHKETGQLIDMDVLLERSR